MESIIVTEDLTTPDSEVALLFDPSDSHKEKYELIWEDNDHAGGLAEDQDEQCYLLVTENGFEALLPFDDLDDAYDFSQKIHTKILALAEIRAES